MKSLPRLLTTLLFTFSLTIFTSSSAHAQVTIVVSPPRHDIEANPGDVVQKTVKITNNSNNTITLTAQIFDFIVTDDFGTPEKVGLEEAGRFAASNWFIGDATQLTIEPKQSRTVSYIITIPADALPGGHYAGAFFKYEEYDTSGETVSKTTPEVGSLFSINIPGDITFDALVKSFKTSSRVYEYGPIEFEAQIENLSDTHIRPISKITVRNMIGQTVAEIPLEELNIFPFTSRTLTETWDTLWGLGRYEAVLDVAYGSGNAVEAAIYFWILPYKIIIAILILLAVLLVIFISVRRHLHHRRDDRDDQIDSLKRKIVDLENKQ